LGYILSDFFTNSSGHPAAGVRCPRQALGESGESEANLVLGQVRIVRLEGIRQFVVFVCFDDNIRLFGNLSIGEKA
jgi:hypothetical protein